VRATGETGRRLSRYCLIKERKTPDDLPASDHLRFGSAPRRSQITRPPQPTSAVPHGDQGTGSGTSHQPRRDLQP